MEAKVKRLPRWLVTKTPKGAAVRDMKKKLRGRGLFTVCESARCPNVGRCFEKPTATFLIMGNNCTRNCGFCAIGHNKPVPLDPDEPQLLAEQAIDLGLKHVVITSVTRDDLDDGGAAHFIRCATAVKNALPGAAVEILTPDFKGRKGAIKIISHKDIDIFNHNLETVPRLYSTVRPKADYEYSLSLLKRIKRERPNILTKSGLMVGLGETKDEVKEVFCRLGENQVDAVTVGQYLRPTLKNLPVVEYLHPDQFEELSRLAKKAGISHVACGPLVRSSYNADSMFQKE